MEVLMLRHLGMSETLCVLIMVYLLFFFFFLFFGVCVEGVWGMKFTIFLMFIYLHGCRI